MLFWADQSRLLQKYISEPASSRRGRKEFLGLNKHRAACLHSDPEAAGRPSLGCVKQTGHSRELNSLTLRAKVTTRLQATTSQTSTAEIRYESLACSAPPRH